MIKTNKIDMETSIIVRQKQELELEISSLLSKFMAEHEDLFLTGVEIETRNIKTSDGEIRSHAISTKIHLQIK